jgi:hypothetical protein
VIKLKTIEKTKKPRSKTTQHLRTQTLNWTKCVLFVGKREKGLKKIHGSLPMFSNRLGTARTAQHWSIIHTQLDLLTHGGGGAI